MVLTNASIDTFFTNAKQMALPARIALKLREEGIWSPADLLEFDTKSMSQIADNLRRPGGRVADPNDTSTTIAIPPFVFSTKSQQQLNIACKVVRFYEMIGHTLTAPNSK